MGYIYIIKYTNAYWHTCLPLFCTGVFLIMHKPIFIILTLLLFFNPPRASEELLFLLIFFLSHNISLHQFQPSGLPQGSPSST